MLKNQVQYPISAQMNFIFRARMLWRDLATWLRAYKVSLYGGVGNSESLSQRLYQIPLEYGNMLRVFVGDEATEKYINLLSQYIILLQSLFIAQINNDVNLIDDLTKQIYRNTKERAALFAQMNPYWSQSEWITLMNAFTQMQIEEATTFLTQDYDRNIEIFDRILSLTTIMGDYFSEGLTFFFMLNPYGSQN
ncbi:MAG: hypothetical protein K0R19_3617 [Bacillota bacterium]|jgi:hypothetical protein|nr:hypothetical protein [Bacillota bacterium]